MVKDKFKLGRLMYMFEATLEYFISILVSITFLAKLTQELGISDSFTGVISSFISLGCIFQLLSVFVRRSHMKRFVIIMSMANQFLFMFLYILPIADFSKTVKTVLFVLLIFVAYILYYITHPKKINWFMSLVEDNRRGRFTANKEILSLVAGIAFTNGMGWVMDYFFEIGNKRMAFLLGAIVIFVLTIFHTLTMVFTVEKTVEPLKSNNGIIKDLLKNKDMLKVATVFVLYYVATYSAIPFYGTYIIGELRFSLKLAAMLIMVGSVSRIFVSRFWGKYADKKGFARMIEKCFMVLILAYVCVMIATPVTGKVMFAFYYLLNGIALGGVNSALTNLVFDYVAPERRADSLAVCQAVAGTVGFFATLCMSSVMTLIQREGNNIFGITVYSQQLFSFFSALILMGAIVYIRKGLIKK